MIIALIIISAIVVALLAGLILIKLWGRKKPAPEPLVLDLRERDWEFPSPETPLMSDFWGQRPPTSDFIERLQHS